MKPLKFTSLLNIIINEFEQKGSIFDIDKNFFYYKQDKNYYKFFDYILDLPFGPAAGPHTQLTQNIISSYLTGGRYIELKTVQILDNLVINRPCIDAEDECYNIEWSQELKLEESFDEYLKAFLLINFLNFVFGFSKSENSGFALNMSVGYDLKGISSKKVDDFIEKMKNAELSEKFTEYKNLLINLIYDKSILSLSKNFNQEELIEKINNISPIISNSVTLSTMHGCPANEIKDIAEHLIARKKLNTLVKLNPTLLGFNRVREILDNTGYNYIQLDEKDFENDLQYDKALEIINHLREFASENNKHFGIKLSNTLVVNNNKKYLNSDKMYLSGRALYLITSELANKILTDIPGLNISYSGGVNVRNLKKILSKGLLPVTVATDILKPPGYIKFNHYAQIIKESTYANFEDENYFYSKSNFKTRRKIINKSLPLFDCFAEPCKYACPIGQSIPEYIELTKQKNYTSALNLILNTNPLPNITGYICDHQCMYNCTRLEYDNAVDIREIKKIATEAGYDEVLKTIQEIEKTKCKIGIIGAGPSGLSAAYFLSKAGYDVTIFEKENVAGGIVKNIIPGFRIPQEIIDKDIELIKRLGVKFVFNKTEINLNQLEKEGFKYFYLAIGAHKAKTIKLNENNENIINALDFLHNFNKNKISSLGKKVIVIGGGNSAMDAARAAKKIQGVESVKVVYRRTREQMPADYEEFEAAAKDGVEFHYLLSPVSFLSGILKCQKQKLIFSPNSTRMGIEPIEDEFHNFYADYIILAIGEELDTDLLDINGIIPTNGLATSKENVFIGGDARRGPSTVVESIADGKAFAETVFTRENDPIISSPNITEYNFNNNFDEVIKERKKIIQVNQGEFLQNNCLICNYECNRCVEVCPNRANVIILTKSYVEFKDKNQILHLYDLCNECGNCETFCPYNGSPYKDKFTYFSQEDDFNKAINPGFIYHYDSQTKEKVLRIRFNKEIIIVKNIEEVKAINEKLFILLKEIFERYDYIL